MTSAFGWPEILATLTARQDLRADAASWAMGQIMSGDATPSQVAGFVMALQTKGVTIEELHGIAEEMLAYSHAIEVPSPSIDIVGTGGDRQNTVNISTMSAIVAAAAGATVVKHGNRAASSKSGTADCLEALGVRLSLHRDQVARVAAEVGITFCFAQDFHPSMRHAAATRRELGVPTVFNLLGPLTNPARPTHAAVGVAMAPAAPLVAGVFAERGTAAAVFRGEDGLDELTVTGPSRLWWVRQGQVTEYEVRPDDVGLGLHTLDDIRGGEPAENAEVVRRLVADDTSGRMRAVRDAVSLNAGLALTVLEPAQPVVDQASFVAALRAGVVRADDAVRSGLAASLLDRWRRRTSELSAL